MIEVFVQRGMLRSEIMYQYSMDIPPGQHWADVWMTALQEAAVCICMIEEAYLKSQACISEFLNAGAQTQRIIVLCHSEFKDQNSQEMTRLARLKPSIGAPGCGAVCMQLATGKQVYIDGSVRAAECIAQRYFSHRGPVLTKLKL